MSDHTRVGCSLWDWPAWSAMSSNECKLWLALYTSAEAKRAPPGLWHGGVGALAEASRMSAQDTITSLAGLVEREVVEHDHRARVIAMTELPDTLERPANDKCLMSIWTKFKTIPECATRNRWVDLLEWLFSEKPMTEVHLKVWATTFATVRRPGGKARRRSDRSTVTAQGLLFDSQPSPLIPPTSEVGTIRSSTVPATVTLTHWIPDQGSGSGSDLGSETTPHAEPAMAFTVAQLIGTLRDASGGVFPGAFDGRLSSSVTTAIKAATAAGFTLADVEVAGAWLAAGALSWRGDSLGASWAAKTGNLVEALDHARAWDQGGRTPVGGRRGNLALVPPAQAPGPAAPAPASAFKSGRRTL